MSHEQKGFTLLELLVAMTLLVVVVGALYSTYFALMKGREVASAGMESRRELRGTLDMLRREITSAVYARTNKRHRFVVEDRDSFGKPASNLDFTAFVPPRSNSLPQSDQGSITSRSEARNGGLVLMREAKDLYVTAKAPSYPQIEELEGFLVECLNGDKWVRNWDTALNGRLPKSVRVTIRIKDGERTVDYTTIASPMVTN